MTNETLQRLYERYVQLYGDPETPASTVTQVKAKNA